MSSSNEIWLNLGTSRQRLDLDDDTRLLPSFQANDRAKPDSIQADYSPEFSVPGTAHNHRLLRHAASSQPAQGQAYARLACVLTSGGVETLPLGLLYVKGWKDGRYQLQLAGGNRRLVEALKHADGSDKMLADLDLSRFNHYYTPAAVLAGLPYAHWQANGWGYEVLERGKTLDLQALNPYDIFPACSANLVWQELLTEAGFTADSLLDEPLFAALNVPAANPYRFSSDFRDARQLTAGFQYMALSQGIKHTDEFSERLILSCTGLAPFHAPTTGATYVDGRYVADTLGYYDLAASALVYCGAGQIGTVGCRVGLRVNGQDVLDPAHTDQQLGVDEKETGPRAYLTLTPKLSRYLLHPGDTVELYWTGVYHKGLHGTVNPQDAVWVLGPGGTTIKLPGGQVVANEVRFTATLLEDFPPGGLVRLQDWLPEMKQLDFVKTIMLLLGLTIQVDQYLPHLRLAAGNKLLANIARAKNWTAKRDAFAQPGRLPERDLSYRFGTYGQTNTLAWVEDDHVTSGYGNGILLIADQVLDTTNTLATLPFAATQPSPLAEGLLRILNFEAQDLAADPITYSAVEAKPRLTLRGAGPEISGQLITTPADATTGVVQVLAAFTTTASYFAGVELSLALKNTVLTTYWADLRAMLDQTRYLVELYRLTPQDIAELDFSVPIYDAVLGDYFAVSSVGEYDARRSVEVKLCRLNPAHLPAPAGPGSGTEFYSGEFWTGSASTGAEFY